MAFLPAAVGIHCVSHCRPAESLVDVHLGDCFSHRVGHIVRKQCYPLHATACQWSESKALGSESPLCPRRGSLPSSLSSGPLPQQVHAYKRHILPTQVLDYRPLNGESRSASATRTSFSEVVVGLLPSAW